MRLASTELSPVEIKALLDAEARGTPFVAYRDGIGDLRLTPLPESARLTIGRGTGTDVVLDWDQEVSRTHAQLERLGDDWVLIDDGLSRNGSRVNGERVVGRRRLTDGDVVLVGRTSIVYRAPGAGTDSTLAAQSVATVRLTESEHRVLVALCAPFAADAGPAPVPATNREIAEVLHLSLDGVKTHVRSLFGKLGVGELAQYQKRTELARRAMDRGLVTNADLILHAERLSRDQQP